MWLTSGQWNTNGVSNVWSKPWNRSLGWKSGKKKLGAGSYSLSRSFQFGGLLGQSCVISYCLKDTLDTLKFYTHDYSDDSESQPRRTFFWVHLLLSVLTWASHITKKFISWCLSRMQMIRKTQSLLYERYSVWCLAGSVSINIWFYFCYHCDYYCNVCRIF